MKKILFILLLVHGSFYFSAAQNSVTPGKVTVKFDKGIESTINTYMVEVAGEKQKGFRVQLCSESGNNARGVANSIKSRFLNRYNGIPAYLKWESPNFKVRVGDFKNRLDATLFWKQIVAEFPASYVVIDEINMISFDE